jgi:hypothetical protein
MADRDELTLADMANQIPDPRTAADLYPEAPDPLRLTVRPAGFAAPPNDLAEGRPWGAPDAETGRPGRLFEPDQTPAPPRRALPWLPRTEQQLGGLGRGLGALVEGARDWWNAPPAPPAAPNRSPMGAPPLAAPGPQRGSFAPVNPMAGVRPDRYDVPKDPPLGLRAAGGVVDMAEDVLKIPSRFFQAANVESNPGSSWQDVDMARQQQVKAAADAGMNIAGPGLVTAAARPGASAGMFGGRLARTFDPMKMKLAETMEANGLPANRIWSETGYMRGADKQWMHEISDLGAYYKGDIDSMASKIFDQQNPQRAGKYGSPENTLRSQIAKQDALLKVQGKAPIFLKDVWHHPALFEAYPELRNMPVSHDAFMQASGGYLPRTKDRPASIVYREEGSTNKMARGQTFDTLLHEVQHAIQQIEGFARGTNPAPQTALVKGTAANEIYNKQMQQAPTILTPMQYKSYYDKQGVVKSSADYNNYLKNAQKDREDFQRQARIFAAETAYRKGAGEGLANLVIDRKDLTAMQAAGIYPASMMKTPLDKQKVEFNVLTGPNPDLQFQFGSVLNPTPREMQASVRPSPLLRPPGKTMKEPAWLPVKPTVLDPRRVFSPGVYENPRVVAEKAAENVAAEHPALKELFGVTRADLYDISQQGRRKGNMEPEIHAPKKPGESYVAEGLATPQNEQRILDTLAEGLKHRGLREGMVPWYVMDPMFQHMVKLVGKEQAIKDYQRFNATTAPFSASSDVMTELNRGTAANMYAKRGDYDTFHRFAGADRQNLPPGFPADMSAVGGHAYHAIQSDPVVRWLQTGKHGYGKEVVKIPTYHAASGVPETGFQTRWPVPDAHFARGVGAADVRDTAKPGVAMKGAEYRSMAPWYREKIAEPIGIEAVPAQALQWGTMSRATGVDTPIGAGKLELLSQRIWERARELGIDPKVLRDQVLRGDQHAVGLLTAGGAGAAGLGSLVDPSRYEAR